jgi:transposase-like protein
MEGAFSMKAKIAYEEKIRIVRDYLSGKVGYSDSVKAASNSEATFRQWVAQYTAGGASALLPADRNKSYPATLKERAVKEYLSGKGSLESICLNYQIRSITQLRRWIKVYNAHGDFNSVKHSGGGSYMRKTRSTTQKERIQIAEECIASGKNYGEMALKYKVSYQQARATL